MTVAAEDAHRPLVLDEAGRLYLARYWSYQRDLAARLRKRARGDVGAVDVPALRESVARLFPGTVLDAPEYADAELIPLPTGGGLGRRFAGMVREGFARYAAARDPAERLARLGDFRVLCAHRTGPYGVETVNRLVEAVLRADGTLRGPSRWYEGRPVLVTTNDYQLGLFNGDMGVLASDPATGGALRAFFPGSDGRVRRIPPARLPQHETAWAMTVHKSQGSEFDEVLLLLPAQMSRVVSRELVYTGLTRARSRVRVFTTREVVAASAGRRVERASGLQDLLWA